ncbi:MAG: hypothetical protein RL148_1508 [Planctomycetota bacterium]
MLNFRRWVVFTFLVHLMVIAVDKGGGLLLYLLTRNEVDQHGRASLLASLPFILMSAANLGLATSLVYLLRRNRFGVQKVFETTMTVALVWGTLVGALAAVLVLGLLPLVRPDWAFDPWLVIPMCGAVPLLLVASYGNSIQLATERIKDYGAVHLVSSLAYLPAFFAIFVVLGANVAEGDVPMAVSWGRLVTAAFVAMVVLTMLRNIVKVRLGFDRLFFRAGCSYGWRANLNSTITYLNHRLDLLIVGALYVAPATTGSNSTDLVLEQVAFYSMAVTWAELVWHFPEAMRDLFFSKVAGSTHEQAKLLTPVFSRIGLFVSLVGGLLVMQLVDPVMGTITSLVQSGSNPWYEHWSDPVGQSLLVLLPGTVAFTVSKLLQADLAARDKLQQCVNAQLMVLAVMLAADAALVPDYGAVGAAAASTVAYVVATIYTLWVYSRETGTSSWKCLFVHGDDFHYLGDVVRTVWRKIRRGKL